jgi:hypothetical protein
MQQFSATGFYLIGQMLAGLSRELIMNSMMATTDALGGNKSLSEVNRHRTLQTLAGLHGHCESIGLELAAEHVRDLEKAVTDNHHLNYNTVVVKITELGDAIRREMSGRMFIYIPPERARLYAQPKLFGDKVAANFPSAAFDIFEAGNSLAAARGTACVFHLMRVLEIGLAALGNVFSVSLTHTNWGPAIEECEKKIRNMNQDPAWKSLPDVKEQQEFYSQAISYIGIAKDAWRNYTAHARGKYTEEEADLMLRNIRVFMQRLADKLKEETR